ncbi:hypothetical protein [Streptomyces collinus]|uniref:hypothetical protein n=1 Tax=Streptomyces collinus TaxID=42684 RepID=UPI0036E7764E
MKKRRLALTAGAIASAIAMVSLTTSPAQAWEISRGGFYDVNVSLKSVTFTHVGDADHVYGGFFAQRYNPIGTTMGSNGSRLDYLTTDWGVKYNIQEGTTFTPSQLNVQPYIALSGDRLDTILVGAQFWDVDALSGDDVICSFADSTWAHPKLTVETIAAAGDKGINATASSNISPGNGACTVAYTITAKHRGGIYANDGA